MHRLIHILSILTLGIGLTLLIPSQGSAQLPPRDIFELYPTGEAVIQYVEQRSQAPAMINQSRFYPALLKTPKGFDMEWRAYGNPDSVLLRHTVWSRALGNYVDLPYPAREAGSFGKSFQQLHPDPVLDLNIYYGYRGWADDVIREYGDKIALSSSELNGLGRAYSQKSMEVLGDPQGQYRDNPCPADDCDWDEFEKWAALGVEKFEKLALLHPEFTTYIGSARLKAENERMYVWMNLWMRGRDDRAKKWLKPGMYSEDVRFLARGMLQSCPKNSIFFVEGDAVTYPLLYLQEQEGLRTDVTVVNATLMLVPAYMRFIREGRGRSHRLRMQLPDSLHSDASSMFYYPGPAASMLLDQLAKHFREKGFKDPVLPGGALRFTFEKEEVVIQLFQYVMRNVLAIADIIQSESARRPICFAPGFGTDLNPFRSYLYRDGLVYRFTGRINAEMDIMQPFEAPKTAWSHMREALAAFPGESEPGMSDLLADTEIALMTLSGAAATQEDEALAQEIFNWYWTNLYPRTESRPATMVVAANVASLIGLEEKAKAVMSAFAAQVKEGKFDESNSQSRLRLNIALDHMIDISQRLDDPALSVKLKWERERLRKLDE